MNKEKQRIAIAEACGHGDYITQMNGWHDNQIHGLPDYLNDLNAMHEAEKVLVRLHWVYYLRRLQTICDESVTWLISATAAQRAEAFLRAIGKWEDE